MTTSTHERIQDSSLDPHERKNHAIQHSLDRAHEYDPVHALNILAETARRNIPFDANDHTNLQEFYSHVPASVELGEQLSASAYEVLASPEDPDVELQFLYRDIGTAADVAKDPSLVEQAFEMIKDRDDPHLVQVSTAMRKFLSEPGISFHKAYNQVRTGQVAAEALKINDIQQRRTEIAAIPSARGNPNHVIPERIDMNNLLSNKTVEPQPETSFTEEDRIKLNQILESEGL